MFSVREPSPSYAYHHRHALTQPTPNPYAREVSTPICHFVTAANLAFFFPEQTSIILSRTAKLLFPCLVPPSAFYLAWIGPYHPIFPSTEIYSCRARNYIRAIISCVFVIDLREGSLVISFCLSLIFREIYIYTLKYIAYFCLYISVFI